MPLPRWMAKERLVGLTPMVGGTGAGVTVGGATSCLNIGISVISRSKGAGSLLVWLELGDCAAATEDVAADAEAT